MSVGELKGELFNLFFCCRSVVRVHAGWGISRLKRKVLPFMGKTNKAKYKNLTSRALNRVFKDLFFRQWVLVVKSGLIGLFSKKLRSKDNGQNRLAEGMGYQVGERGCVS